MAAIASVDRSLSRFSSWMSGAAFAGLVALAFLPPRGGPHDGPTVVPPLADAAKSRPQTAVAAPAPAGGTAVVAPPPAPATPAAPGGTAPSGTASALPPDTWTPDELTAGLRQCLRLLAPRAADIELEQPMKHGQCGTPAPLVLRSLGEAEKVEFTPAPTMNCRLAASLGDWVEKVLQPVAQEVLGSRVKRIIGSSSYACRNIYNNPKLTLSEHATGNAVDIAGFVTADGRTVIVGKAWGPTERDIAAAKKKALDKGKTEEKDGGKDGEPPALAPTPSIDEQGKSSIGKEKGQLVKANYKRAAASDAKAAPAAGAALAPATTKEATFLKRLHGGSCKVFTTVLGPEANDAHRDHFHLDMKVRANGYTVCH